MWTLPKKFFLFVQFVALLFPLVLLGSNKTRSCKDSLIEVAKARLELVTKASGTKIPFKVGTKKMEALYQPEWEFKLNIPREHTLNVKDGGWLAQTMNLEQTFSIRGNYAIAQSLLTSPLTTTGEQYDAIAHPKEDMAWGRTKNLQTLPGFRLAPLGSRQTRYHLPGGEGQYKKQAIATTEGEGKVAEEKMTEVLRFALPTNGPEDLVWMRAKVGSQKEISLYFDSPQKSLAKKGIALRVKRWYESNGQYGEKAEPVAAMLFIKRDTENLGALKGREEYQVSISKNTTDAEAIKIGTTLLQQGLGEKPPQNIQKVVTLSTNRLGLNLVYTEPGKKPRKVGFVTVDQYGPLVSKRVRTGFDQYKEIEARKEELYQIELEIFPDPKNVHFVQQHQEELETYLQQLEDFFKGSKATEQPKYQTGIEVLRKNGK